MIVKLLTEHHLEFLSLKGGCIGSHRKRGSSVVRHLPLVLEVPGLIPARGEENFGVRTPFPLCHL